MLQALVSPWLVGWPTSLHNLNMAASPPASRFHLGLQTTSIHVSTPNGIGNCSSSSAQQAAFEGVYTAGRTAGGLAE